MPESKVLTEDQKLKAKLKEERRLAFEAKRVQELKGGKVNEKENKSKADLRKERREKQEAQRALKLPNSDKTKLLIKETSENQNKQLIGANAPKANQDPKNVFKKSDHVTPTSKNINQLDVENAKQVKTSPIAGNKLTKKGQIFPHIPKRESNLDLLTEGLGYNSDVIHTSIIKIGLRMNQNKISDSTSRCIALLSAIKDVLRDYKTPTSKQMSRDLEEKIDNYSKFLNDCRPLSVSMKNVLRILKRQFSKLDSDISEFKAKKKLMHAVDKFMYEEIECGLVGIREHGNLKIKDGDVILTFGNSFLVKHIFAEAAANGKKFRVVVVDAYPRLEGKIHLEFLINLGIEVTYILINAIAYVMKEVNKVLIEAHTLLANGYTISEMGCSQIALVAKAYNVPVMICCETYKFSERVHTDSFVFNEADSVRDFLKNHRKPSKLKDILQTNEQNETPQNLNVLNLHYDITPPDFISLVITEMGFLPCTAVPAIIRRNISKFQLEV